MIRAARAMPVDNGGGSNSGDTSAASIAAFFDVDGTIVSTHIVHQFIHVHKEWTHRHAGPIARAVHPIWYGCFLLKCLQYLYLDRRSRSRMNIVFYRNYAGFPADQLHALADACFENVLKPNIFGPARACVRNHLTQGNRVVFVTGSIDFLMRPLADHLAKGASSDTSIDIIARSLVSKDGRMTGELSGPPIGEDEKARQIRGYAQQHNIDLSASHAYGDSIADLPMLDIVGNPHAINPDHALTEIARERRWDVQSWDKVGQSWDKVGKEGSA